MTNAELIAKIKAEIERRKSLLIQHSKLIYDLILETFIKEYDDILSFLSTIESEKPIIPNDLEEAAEKYAKAYTDNDNGNGGDDWEDDIKITFIAGAKWQADHTPLPEDTVLLNKGVEEGKRLMMEEAVEGTIDYVYDEKGDAYKAIRLDWLVGDFGDKVRVIICKKEDKV